MFVFAFKITIICFFFILVRAILPRYRYDQLMFFCWKRLMPFTIGYFIFVAGYLSFSKQLVNYLYI
jgi:NADH:ubiquinone oxidoreductase subunit H